MPERKQTPQQLILMDFASDWEARVGSKYFIDWGKDGKWANTLIEMGLNPDEYTARKRAFFADEKWWEFGRWGFAVFVNNINKFVTIQKKQQTKGRVQMILCMECGNDIDASKACPHCKPVASPWSKQ
jgi:hypothetical protein